MNRFYTWPKAVQWTAALLLFAGGAALTGKVIGYGMEHLLLYVPLLFLVVPAIQFAFTPFFKLIGLYRYLSPMLLVYAPNEKVWGLHNGTSFDYLFVLRGTPAGAPLRRRILTYYLEGLLRLADLVEKGEVSEETLIKGSSYFFSERTAERLGFELVEIPSFEKFNLYFNYLDLLWQYSVAYKTLRFPNLKEAKTAQISAGTLLRNRPRLERLHNYLKNG
jgi:hypothetical protein